MDHSRPRSIQEDLLNFSFRSGDSKVLPNLYQEAKGSSDKTVRPIIHRFRNGRVVQAPPSISDTVEDENENEFRISTANSLSTLTSSFSPEGPLAASGGTFTVAEEGNDSLSSTYSSEIDIPGIISSEFEEERESDLARGYEMDLVSKGSSIFSDDRRFRKVSKVSTARNKTTQEDLAEAIIDGNTSKIEEIIDVYIAINGEGGFKLVMEFKYEYNLATQLVTPIEYNSFTNKNRLMEEDPDYNKNLNILDLAVIFDQEGVMSLLTLYGISKLQTYLRAPSYPLHVAAFYTSIHAAKFLIKLGCDINGGGFAGETALHVACRMGNTDMVILLILQGADLEIKDAKGQTPLHYSVHNYSCTRALVINGAQMNITDEDGQTPLHLASDKIVITHLLHNGADPGATDKLGRDVIKTLTDHSPDSMWSFFDFFVDKNSASSSSEYFEVSYRLSLFENANYSSGVSLLEYLIYTNNTIMLKHPLIEIFIHTQDAHAGSMYRLLMTVLYLIFLTFITAVVFVRHSSLTVSSSMSESSKKDITLAFLIISTIMLVILSLMMSRQFMHIFRNKLKYVWVIGCGLFVAYFVLIHSHPEESYTLQLGTAMLFLFWSYFTNILGQFPSVGIYILMVEKIAYNISKFLIIYLSTILAFVISFHILFSHDKRFDNPFSALISTLVMMNGEIEYKELFTENLPHPGVSYLIFFLFFLFVTIVILNLLVGLAISNITEVFMDAGIKRLELTTTHLIFIQELYKLCLNFAFPRGRFDVITYLRKKLYTKNKVDIPEDPLVLYIFPNKDNHIYLKLQSGTFTKTRFKVPEWIVRNTKKLFDRKQEVQAKAGQLEAEASEDKGEIKARFRSLKNDIRDLRKDIRVLQELLRVKI